MRILLTLALLVGLLFSVSSNSFAQDRTTVTPTGKTLQERNLLLEQSKDPEATRRALLQRKQDFKVNLETRKINAKVQMETRKKALKAKLDGFKDASKRKADTAERVSNNLNKKNENSVELMTQQIERIEEILGKVELSTAAAKAEGKDVAGVEAAIASAHAAIDRAKAAVANLAGKDYTLSVTDESTVKTDAQKSRNTLRSDLKNAHDLIVAARRAVGNTISLAYGSLGKEKVDAK